MKLKSNNKFFCLKKPAVGVPTGPQLFLWAGGKEASLCCAGGLFGGFGGFLGYFYIFSVLFCPPLYINYIYNAIYIYKLYIKYI